MVLHGNYAGIESYSEHIGEERFDPALAAYLRYLRTAESIFIALKDKMFCRTSKMLLAGLLI